MDEKTDDQAERFERTLRNLLNTPPKPHGKGVKATEKEEPRDARTSPGPRSGKRQEDRGESG